MFKKIYIEITSICNLACSFCPSTKLKRQKRSLSVDEFRTIIKQAQPLCEEVCLYLMGEPLCHPELEKILNICSEEGVKAQISTNAVLLTKYTDVLLKSKALRQINFSLQANKELKNIISFCKQAKELRPELYINLRLWNVGVEDNAELLKEIENSLSITINRNIDVKSIKSKKIWNNVFLHFDSRFEWPSLDKPLLNNKGTCYGMHSHIGILCDGTVVPCCLDSEGNIPLGNCLKESLLGILNSERAKNIKKGFEKNILVEELCKRCAYIQRFSKKA